MQSHQDDIKANPLGLPIEILLEIANTLRPEDAVRFFSTSAEFRKILQENHFWKQKLQQHFPGHIRLMELQNQINIDWRAEFIKADKIDYGYLMPQHKKLFSIVKAGDLESFAAENYSLDDLCLRANGMSAINYANGYNQHAILNYIYEKLASPYFSSTPNGSFDTGKEDRSGHSMLHWAVYCQQDLKILKHLIKAGFDVNSISNRGTTALYIAARYGHLAVVEVLLAKGANVNAAKTDGATALYTAAENGHLAIVKALLAKGANVNAATDYERGTALYIAARYGHLAVVEALLAKGATVDAATEWGSNALSIAARYGHLAIVKTLLAQGASIDGGAYGFTALYFAAEYGHLAVVEALLAQGADVNTATIGDGKTPLYIATRNGHDEVTKALTIQILLNYIKNRADDTAPEYLNSIRIFGHDFHPGSSKQEKVAAARMLKCVLEGADPSCLQGHEKALGHGELGKIYAPVKDNISRMQSETLPRFTG